MFEIPKKIIMNNEIIPAFIPIKLKKIIKQEDMFKVIVEGNAVMFDGGSAPAIAVWELDSDGKVTDFFVILEGEGE